MTLDEVMRVAGLEYPDDGFGCACEPERVCGTCNFRVRSNATRAAILSYGRSERERAAKVCDVTPPYPFRPSIEAAHAIRSLPDEPAQEQEIACRA